MTPRSNDSRSRTDSPATGRLRMLGASERSSSVGSHGSHTVVVEAEDEATAPTGILHLRAGHHHEPSSASTSNGGDRAAGAEEPHVRWSDDTVDNENMNKKKSKICCIYRRERQFGESDSESSSCDSDSEGGPNTYERVPRHTHRGCK
ncbi:Type 1 phosphatases regulator ypi1 [Coemansia sp. RSA 552]|nr:Type 1 phosphatases regulator ypi1 [Coemansia sp. RSA 552]